MSESSNSSNQSTNLGDESRLVNTLLTTLRDMRFGSIEIVVHEGRATLIERKEKFRLVP